MELTFGFPNRKKSRNLLILTLIPKIVKLENTKFVNSENSKICELGKFEKFSILKIPKISNFENHRISEIVWFRKIENFQTFTI